MLEESARIWSFQRVKASSNALVLPYQSNCPFCPAMVSKQVIFEPKGRGSCGLIFAPLDAGHKGRFDKVN